MSKFLPKTAPAGIEIGLITINPNSDFWNALQRILPEPQLRFRIQSNLARAPKEDSPIRVNRAGMLAIDTGEQNRGGFLQFQNLKESLLSSLPLDAAVSYIRTYESEEQMAEEPERFQEKLEIRLFGRSEICQQGRIDFAKLKNLLSVQPGGQEIGFASWHNEDGDGVGRTNLVLFYSPHYAPKGAQKQFKKEGRTSLRFYEKEGKLFYE